MIRRHQLFRSLLLLGAFLGVAAMEPPPQPNILPPEQAAKEGRALVDEMLSRKPDENSTVTGLMTIRRKKTFTQIPIKFQTIVTPTNWLSIYEASEPAGVRTLTVTHVDSAPNKYAMGFQTTRATEITNAFETYSFAGSDFSVGDLGLEFLHWPDQRLLQKEMKRSRSCRVLESFNPRPGPGGYSRIKSWVDAESDGIVQAVAYDVNGNELKQFFPKDFSKVNGQWQLEEMQISNSQTDSTTTVKFNLK